MQTTSSFDFDEVTRRIKSDKKSEIFEQMSKVNPMDLDKIQQELLTPECLLNKGRLIYQDDFPYIALRALHEQRISVSEFATLQTLWAKKEEMKPRNPIIRYIPMYSAGTKNPAAELYLLSMLSRSNKMHWLFKKNSVQQLDELYKKISSLKPINQGFWLVSKVEHSSPLNKDDKYAYFKKHSITDEIRLATDTHPMCLPSGQVMVISSIDLFQIWLNINFAEAVKVNPVLGVSSVNDIREGSVKRHRDLAIPFPGLELPKQADNFSAPSVLDFMFHDRYHCLRSSEIGAKQTLKYVQIADDYQALQQKLKTHLDGLKLKRSGRKAHVEEFLAKISRLSAEQQKKAKIELGKKLHHEQNIIRCLEQIIRFTGQVKFRLYDMEHPIFMEKSHIAFIFNVEVHIVILKNLPNAARFLPSYVKVLVDHFFAVACFSPKELAEIRAMYVQANQVYANLSSKERPFITAVLQHTQNVNNHDVHQKHLFMFGLVLGLAAISGALTAYLVTPVFTNLVLLMVAVLLETTLGLFAYKTDSPSAQP